MAIVVDKELIKNQIIEAFDRLSLERPLTDISLREIAVEAGMFHSKILRYFGNKNSLYEACVHWVAEKQKNSVVSWLELRKYEKDIDKIDYLNQFFGFLCAGEFKAVSYSNTYIFIMDFSLLSMRTCSTIKHPLCGFTTYYGWL